MADDVDAAGDLEPVAVFNYAGSSVTTTGLAMQPGDTDPTYVDPSLSCWAVGIAAGSAAFTAPVNFVGITGGWGPPGFVVPQTGTPPSWPSGC